ncbi:37S ribosomal protein subunit sws2, mitochondrial [Malassezia restricta CBS 7877]|uniref:37S ribosomal protein subunit sws2, mitochondrial n=1 Tax=Malassezia restricta (strain ATCC 96810 / NBRC 103918 / CBS 7877) TaxID=425264 RepID=A0A3G2S1R4_MALR7|nr:37S ribosomal protein subunit sws2, mitochondrial [Malassezia restricta CBS 7877]
MYLLGTYLPDHKLVRIALTNFYGISYDTARRLCARIRVHDQATVSSLTETQITELSAYLSSPSMIPAASPSQTRSTLHGSVPPSPASSNPADLPPSQRPKSAMDPLRSIVLEGDLRREVLANIAHHRSIGSYVGRRHAGGYPARGQRTQSNALTARRLNRLERRQYSTSSVLSDVLRPLARMRFM